MGSGKTTVGKRLAAVMNREFLDTDERIEENEGMTISRIFAEKGEAYFRETETQLIRRMIENEQGKIISTGGGMPLRPENAALLKQLGLVVYLKSSEEAVYERLRDKTDRPLLAGPDPRRKIRELLEYREPLYSACAELTLVTDGKMPEALVREIIEVQKSESAKLNRIKELCEIASEHIRAKNIGCFAGMDKPLFMISETYPGIWLEHVYDSVFYAKLEPGNAQLAKNTLNLFLDNQSEEGQLPCYVLNRGKNLTGYGDVVGYGQIQECVSFAALCLEVCVMTGDKEFLVKCYEAAKRWEGWLRKYRMTQNMGLVEMFCGFDTGHDNSARFEDISCKGNYRRDGVTMNASVMPPDDGITPIAAVDMNCNFYATEKALEEMARLLDKPEEAAEWSRKAAEVKERLFAVCYDEDDCFFYDVDRNGRKRRYRSSTILHLFLEKVLDPKEDQELIAQIYTRYLHNPKEFWTEYPFPSMSVSDPSWKKHTQSNCWGYFSQALIALRCTRWMDAYGLERDFDQLCEKWVQAWTDGFETAAFGQELDPLTGIPSECSQWYSSCMLFYVYAVRRLGLV